MIAGALAILALLAGHALTAHSLHGNRATQPPEDFTLTLYAIGAWRGQFDVDQAGQGGLAALHTMVETARREASVGDRGGVLLVQSGDFTGGASADELLNKIEYPALNLLRYLRLDALGPTAAEALGYAALPGKRPGYDRLPVASFNFRPASLAGTPGPGKAVPPLQLVRRSSYTTLITAVTSGSEPQFGTDPAELLAAEFRRQTGADLYVLLLDRRPEVIVEPVVDSHDLHGEPVAEKRAEYLNAADLLQSERFWQTFFPDPPGAMRDPYALPDEPLAQQWLIIESSAPFSRFMRLPEGPYLCSIAGTEVCEITVEFRRHRVRGVRARFIQLNAVDTPGGWVTPDPLLLQVLKKQT